MHRHCSRLSGAFVLPAILMIATAFSGVSAKADTFNLSPIVINTQSLDGTTGYLLFDYSPSTNGTTPITSTVNVTGLGFSSFSLQNTGGSNYELVPFTFGNNLTFSTSFNTTATPGADETTLFGLFALDSGYNPIPTADPTGSNTAVLITQSADGSVSNPIDYAPFNPIPEASSMSLFALLALGSVVALVARRRVNA